MITSMTLKAFLKMGGSWDKRINHLPSSTNISQLVHHISQSFKVWLALPCRCADNSLFFEQPVCCRGVRKCGTPIVGWLKKGKIPSFEMDDLEVPPFGNP